MEIDDNLQKNRNTNRKLNETIDTIQLISRRLDVAYDHVDKLLMFDSLVGSRNLERLYKHNQIMGIEQKIEIIRCDIMRLKEEFKHMETYSLTNLDISFDLMYQEYFNYDQFTFPEYHIRKNIRQEMKTIRDFQSQLQNYIEILKKEVKENETT